MRYRLVLLVLLAMACSAPTRTNSLLVDVVARPAPQFEGEPIYVLVTVRNLAPEAIAAPWNVAACAEINMVDAGGGDLRRSRVVIDFIGTPAPLRLRSDSLLYWVQPLHWFFGATREPGEIEHYAVPPGTNNISVTFAGCAVYGAPEFGSLRAAVSLQVRPRTAPESAARQRVLAASDSAISLVRTSRRISDAIPILTALVRDTTLSSYRPYVLLDVATVLNAWAQVTPDYRDAIDSMRIEYLRTFASADPVAVRLITHLGHSAIASLSLSEFPPALQPFLLDRRTRLSP